MSNDSLPRLFVTFPDTLCYFVYKMSHPLFHGDTVRKSAPGRSLNGANSSAPAARVVSGAADSLHGECAEPSAKWPLLLFCLRPGMEAAPKRGLPEKPACSRDTAEELV